MDERALASPSQINSSITKTGNSSPTFSGASAARFRFLPSSFLSKKNRFRLTILSLLGLCCIVYLMLVISSTAASTNTAKATMMMGRHQKGRSSSSSQRRSSRSSINSVNKEEEPKSTYDPASTEDKDNNSQHQEGGNSKNEIEKEQERRENGGKQHHGGSRSTTSSSSSSSSSSMMTRWVEKLIFNISREYYDYIAKDWLARQKTKNNNKRREKINNNNDDHDNDEKVLEEKFCAERREYLWTILPDFVSPNFHRALLEQKERHENVLRVAKLREGGEGKANNSSLKNNNNKNENQKFIIWSLSGGVGNRFLSLSSTLIAAILSKRVLLMKDWFTPLPPVGSRQIPIIHKSQVTKNQFLEDIPKLFDFEEVVGRPKTSRSRQNGGAEKSSSGNEENDRQEFLRNKRMPNTALLCPLFPMMSLSEFFSYFPEYFSQQDKRKQQQKEERKEESFSSSTTKSLSFLKPFSENHIKIDISARHDKTLHRWHRFFCSNLSEGSPVVNLDDEGEHGKGNDGLTAKNRNQKNQKEKISSSSSSSSSVFFYPEKFLYIWTNQYYLPTFYANPFHHKTMLKFFPDNNPYDVLMKLLVVPSLPVVRKVHQFFLDQNKKMMEEEKEREESLLDKKKYIENIGNDVVQQEEAIIVVQSSAVGNKSLTTRRGGEESQKKKTKSSLGSLLFQPSEYSPHFVYEKKFSSSSTQLVVVRPKTYRAAHIRAFHRHVMTDMAVAFDKCLFSKKDLSLLSKNADDEGDYKTKRKKKGKVDIQQPFFLASMHDPVRSYFIKKYGSSMVRTLSPARELQGLDDQEALGDMLLLALSSQLFLSPGSTFSMFVAAFGEIDSTIRVQYFLKNEKNVPGDPRMCQKVKSSHQPCFGSWFQRDHLATRSKSMFSCALMPIPKDVIDCD